MNPPPVTRRLPPSPTLHGCLALLLSAGHGLALADDQVPPPFEPLAARARLHMLPGAPGTTMGLRWRVSDRHLLFADAVRARALGADPSETEVANRVGVEWQAARPRLGLQGGAVGFQLESGYRMSLRARHGGLALYLRGQF